MSNNPFRPGNGTIPPYLAGRDEEMKGFENSLDLALTLPQNLVISGIRRTGKTVLLRTFEDICKEKKWLFVRREFNKKLCQEDEFINAILTDVTTKVKGISIAKKIGKPRVGFRIEEREEVNVYRLLDKYSGPLGDRFESILKDIYEMILKANFKGLVLLYDEFHIIKDDETKGNFPLSLLLETFSHIQQAGMRCYLVLSGLPPLFPNLVEAKTYAERMFRVDNIGNLSQPTSREAITVPLKNSPWSFSKELVEKLCLETHGYPYFLQFYSYYLINNIPKEKIGIRDFEGMRSFLLKELDNSFFKGRFERASNSERDVLAVMAEIGAEIDVSQISKKIKISRNVLNQILIKLMEKGLIYRVRRGKYAFSLPLFEKFILREIKGNVV